MILPTTIHANIYDHECILFHFELKLCSSLEKYCQEAVKSITKVDICPTSKEEWDKAASKKNCSVMAAMQNCANTESFLYYCVIDRFQKETLELCAPKTIIRGNALIDVNLKKTKLFALLKFEISNYIIHNTLQF